MVAFGVPAIVTANRVPGPRGQPVLVVSSPDAAVIGNVTSGSIVLGGQPLPPTLAALNPMLP